jgi:uncharacterized protein
LATREDAVSATASWLPDGKRMHFNHGPIDLIIEASGDPHEVQKAYESAFRRFETVLEELVSELSNLGEEITSRSIVVNGDIARTMVRAVAPHWRNRVTPMAAVAGSIAEHILAAMTEETNLTKAYVNNGGDIALHLTEGEVFEIAAPSGNISIQAEDNVRGIATSGWRGRSFSLGIADAVTVLAPSAAVADVVATLIANAVDLPDTLKIKRQPANEISPGSDLKDRLVTIGVDPLTKDEVMDALNNGLVAMERLLHEQHFEAVSLMLDTEVISLKCTRPQLEDTDDSHQAA